MMKCQECGNDEAVWDDDRMSASLCPGCIWDRMRKETPEPYDYPNEREEYY